MNYNLSINIHQDLFFIVKIPFILVEAVLFVVKLLYSLTLLILEPIFLAIIFLVKTVLFVIYSILYYCVSAVIISIYNWVNSTYLYIINVPHNISLGFKPWLKSTLITLLQWSIITYVIVTFPSVIIAIYLMYFFRWLKKAMDEDPYFDWEFFLETISYHPDDELDPRFDRFYPDTNLDFRDFSADSSEEDDNIEFKTPTFKEDDYTEFLSKDFLVKHSKISKNKHED